MADVLPEVEGVVLPAATVVSVEGAGEVEPAAAVDGDGAVDGAADGAGVVLR